MTHRDYRNHTVVVTGASSGIGREFAEALAARGSSLVLVARRRDRLDQLAEKLRAAHGVEVLPVPLDLASATAASDLTAAIDSAGFRATALVNNAGFGTF